MRFVEFALRGIRRFEGGRKLAFPEGYTVLSGANESGKTICLRALLATLEPDRLEGRADDLLPAAAPGERVPPRCGLTFLHDGGTYRLVRDLAQGAVNLARLDPSGKAVTQQRDADEVRRWLRDTCGMPARRHFDALFVIERADMPSGRTGRAPRVAGPSARVPPAPVRVVPAGPARAARIAALKAELARIDDMGKVEFRLDGAKAKLFELEAELSELTKLDQVTAELEGAITAFEGLGLDPAQLEGRARGYQGLVEKRAADLAAIEIEREGLERVATTPVTPVLKDPLVLGGAAAAALFLLAGYLLHNTLAAGALAGLGAALLGVVRDTQALARRNAAAEAVIALEDRVQAIEKRFDIETKAVRTAQEVLGVSGAEGILERVERYRALARRRGEVTARRTALAAQKDFATLARERERVGAEVAALEEELRGYAGSGAFDPGELRRELAELEGGPAPQRPDASAETPPGDQRGDGAGSPREAPLTATLEGWLGAAAEILGRDREGLARELLQRVQPVVAPLTADRYRSLAFEGAGQLVAVDAAGQPVDTAACSPATQDALYLGLRLAGYVLLTRSRPWPLVLDDPLVTLDETRLANACRVLRRVAQTGAQVLHFSARPVAPGAADSVLTLP